MKNPISLLRIQLCYLSLLVIGAGSTLFHGTLQYEMQLLDELPMIFGMTVNALVLWQVKKKSLLDSQEVTPISQIEFPRGQYSVKATSAGIIYFFAVTGVYLICNEPIFHEVMFGAISVLVVVMDFWHAGKLGETAEHFVRRGFLL